MKKNAALFLFLTIISCILLLEYYCYVSKLTSIPEKAPKPKNILYWTEMFGKEDFYLGLGSKIFEGCEVTNCYATSNRSFVPIDEFAAILFHGNEYLADKKKPENRSQDQYYVYCNQESPMYTSQWLGSDNFFNWTMTYRSDSDIIRPYGYYKKIPKNMTTTTTMTRTTTTYQMPTVEEVKRKPHKIAWMVSNCRTSSMRSNLYKQLREYLPIDVYGSCGDKFCSKGNFEKCYDMLAKNYKFYLSFENSICKEYVTEKLYAALMRNIVPIAYGGVNYAKITPPNSVIDVSKFNTVEQLAKYIKKLDENPEMYLSYLKWKTEYVVRRDRKPTVCSLCKKLNEPVVHKSYSYSKMYQWWNSSMCKTGIKLPKILFH